MRPDLLHSPTSGQCPDQTEQLLQFEIEFDIDRTFYQLLFCFDAEATTTERNLVFLQGLGQSGKTAVRVA